jgi:hypothetical protein
MPIIAELTTMMISKEVFKYPAQIWRKNNKRQRKFMQLKRKQLKNSDQNWKLLI